MLPGPIVTTKVDAIEKSPEVFNVFYDRYESVSLLCDEVIPPPKMKSVLVKDDLLVFDAP